jgi:hypothetical protein
MVVTERAKFKDRIPDFTQELNKELPRRTSHAFRQQSPLSYFAIRLIIAVY